MKNEPVKSYKKNSEERKQLMKTISQMKNNPVDIPLIIGGKEIRTGRTVKITAPHNHQLYLGEYHIAGEHEIQLAIQAAQEAKKSWESLSFDDRAKIFLKAADLLAGEWRSLLNATTMLGQSKTIHQAEIDAACELIDFFRFNISFYDELYREQPLSTTDEINKMEYRPLEGFVLAISPFNFTSIGGNLATAPAMAGNTVLWKPAGNAVYSNFQIMRLLEAAGMPPGVINFIPSRGKDINKWVIQHSELSGIHFTGSSKTFETIWKSVSTHLNHYKNYPRIVGETGGKDFIFAHSSADIEALNTAIIRGAFEYQGQKCSAASRAYIPKSCWEELKKMLQRDIHQIKAGDVEVFSNFMGAVIDGEAYQRITSYINYAHESEDTTFLCGGNYSDIEGYFIDPAIVITTDPTSKLMEEEIFGPVMTIFVYDDDAYYDTLALCNSISPYALTGAVFANDENAIQEMLSALYYSAGNIYINDKPTGAVVGQQPFGGSRKSGTNDKAGSKLNLTRWVNARNVKRNLNPPKNFMYPFMED